MTNYQFDYIVKAQWTNEDSDTYTVAGFVLRNDATMYAAQLKERHSLWTVSILDVDNNIVIKL